MWVVGRDMEGRDVLGGGVGEVGRRGWGGGFRWAGIPAGGVKEAGGGGGGPWGGGGGGGGFVCSDEVPVRECG